MIVEHYNRHRHHQLIIASEEAEGAEGAAGAEGAEGANCRVLGLAVDSRFLFLYDVLLFCASYMSAFV